MYIKQYRIYSKLGGISVNPSNKLNRMNEEISLILDKNTTPDFIPATPIVTSSVINDGKDVYTMYSVVFSDISYDAHNPDNVVITEDDKLFGLRNTCLCAPKTVDIDIDIIPQQEEETVLETKSDMVLGISDSIDIVEEKEDAAIIVEEDSAPERRPWYKRLFRSIFNKK